MDRTLAIYPTAHKVEDLLRRTAADGCVWDHRHFTFPQLIRRLWRDCRDGRAALEAAGERIVVEEAMRSVSHPELQPTPGLIDHLHGLIRQFKSAALQPDDLNLALTNVPRPGRLGAVAAIFGAYQALLERHRLADAHDRELAVLNLLHDAEHRHIRPALLDGIGRLLVAEIYDFSLLQFMIVVSLTRIIGDATVTIQANPRAVDANRFADLTWNRFVAEESIADQILPDFVRREGRPGALGFVLEHLFAAPLDPPPPPDGTLEIVCAPSRRAEVEYVARAIRRELQADGRSPPARIAVLARDLAPYADYLRTIFRRYRIPLAALHGEPLMATPVARLILAILRAPVDAYGRAGLVALLRSPHLGIGSDAAVRLLAEIGYIDADTSPLAKCLADRSAALAADLAAASSAEERARLEVARRRVDRTGSILERLLQALTPLATPASLADHLARLDDALSILGFDPAGGERADDAARSWGAIRGLLDQLAALAGRGIASGLLETAEFIRILEATMVAAPGLDHDDAQGGVRAMTVLDARGLDFDLAFVMGLDDGSFPIYHGEDPLLTESMRRALDPALRQIVRRRLGARAPSTLGKILRSRSDRNAEDPFLFFLALSMPARRAVLTYPAAEANPLVRSPFVDEVMRILGGAEDRIVKIPAESFIPEAEQCFAPEEFLERAALDSLLERPEAAMLGAPATLASIVNRSRTERQREDWLARPTREDSADEGYRPDPAKFAAAGRFDGRVAPPPALAKLLLADPPGWSATRLDDLAACGFKFFAARILRLRDEEEPDYELSPLEAGSLIHDVLQRLTGELDAMPPEQMEGAVGAILERIRVEQRRAARDPLFFDLAWETISGLAQRVVDYHIRQRRESPEVEVRAEHQFSFTLSGIADGPDLRMRGRVDRLELHRRAGAIELLRVLDYKRSRNDKRYAEFADPEKSEFGWTAMQLPVYLMAALAEFRAELSPSARLEEGYLVLRGRQLDRIFLVDRASIDPDPAMHASIPKRIVAMVGEALAGRFDVDPRRCASWCAYRSVCRNFARKRA